ncbi:DUF805 domain-containing protein [Beijerinckia sp. L45]|uniref:DUF805 domain-containing protein n=1 Tax=Beijerinckia sp. L45 TaxID=1641855 RepID=UPI00131A6A4E|nr:DUF805 domain-containing protein [Beijerinckia sp. L45]
MIFINTAFSATGRFTRLSYWKNTLGLGCLYLIFFGIFYVLMAQGKDGSETLTALQVFIIAVMIVGSILYLWINTCIAIKRLHDRNKSGWWFLLAFVPYVGGLWLLIECGMLRGTAGPNRFGPDPLGRQASTPSMLAAS